MKEKINYTYEEYRRDLSEYNFAEEVRRVLQSLEEALLEKNRKYGDSALNPLRCFSKASPQDAIRVRLDDKLKRMANRQDDDTEDIELDIMGYLTLLRIARRYPVKNCSTTLLPPVCDSGMVNSKSDLNKTAVEKMFART